MSEFGRAYDLSSSNLYPQQCTLSHHFSKCISNSELFNPEVTWSYTTWSSKLRAQLATRSRPTLHTTSFSDVLTTEYHKTDSSMEHVLAVSAMPGTHPSIHRHKNMSDKTEWHFSKSHGRGLLTGREHPWIRKQPCQNRHSWMISNWGDRRGTFSSSPHR